MKKCISFILVLVLAFGLCACNASEETPKGLQVGFGRADITPNDSVPLAGYGKTSDRMSNNTLDPLLATCIAFTEGDNTLLLFTQDIIKCNSTWLTAVRSRIETELGVPGDNVMVCSTHTHSAPDTFSSLPSIAAYQMVYTDGMVDAAKAALEDRASATLYGGSQQIEGMNFVRHYIMGDGSYAGSNFGDFSILPYQGHAAENDGEMLLLKADRGDEKKDILIMNWAAHPCFTGGSTEHTISSDFIGMVRQKIETDTDMHFAYFTGAAGNQNARSKIPSEAHGLNNQTYGEKLGQYAIDFLPQLQAVEGSGIQISSVDFQCDVNHDDQDKINIATAVTNYARTTTSVSDANAFARQQGLSSFYQASAIVARMSRPETGTMKLCAVQIGGMAFVTAPYEMFAAHAVYVKEHSPYDLTMVFSCANEAHSYIPTLEAYEYGCYESYISYFARGSGELAAEKFVSMLTEIKTEP